MKIDIQPLNNNDLCVLTIDINEPLKIGKFIDACISDKSNAFYSHYLAIKDALWNSRKIDCSNILKIVGDDRLSTKNADRLASSVGTIYPYITEQDNKKNLGDILDLTRDYLKTNSSTSRLVIRNLPNMETYINSITNAAIDVPCATQFQFLQDRFVVTFRAHALKSEFIADFCLIYKYYFLPVYFKHKQTVQYQIIANTTQEIEYLQSTEMQKFINSI